MTSSGRRIAFLIGIVIAFMLPKKVECGYPYVFLTTNGRMATAERIRACMAAGLDSLKFSYNFADAQQFQDVTGVKANAFASIAEHIRQARRIRDEVEAETGHRCGLYASSILYDGEQRVKMEQAVDAILPHVDEHYWLPLYGQAGLTRGAKGTRRAEVRESPSSMKKWHVTFSERLT